MKVLRWILLSLLASLIAGFIIGTIIRVRMEGPPVRYFVEHLAQPETGLSIAA